MSAHRDLQQATHTTSEFLASLHYLPQEVAFLLCEIQEKDALATKIQDEIDTLSDKYLRSSYVHSASDSNSQALKTMSDRVDKLFDELHELNAEKVTLAENVRDRLASTQGRLMETQSQVSALEGGHRSESERKIVDLGNTLPHQSRVLPGPSLNTSTTTNKQVKFMIKLPPKTSLRNDENANELLSVSTPPKQARHLDPDENVQSSLLLRFDGVDGGPHCVCHRMAQGEMVRCEGENCEHR